MKNEHILPAHIDYHSHVLPEMDDGARSVVEGREMLQRLHAQGVSSVVATPHCRPHREKSVTQFLARREKSLESLLQEGVLPVELHLGAEVAIEREISNWENIELLCASSTKLILLEFPYTGFSNWMLDEVENIRCGCHLTPVIAHVHRYLSIFSRSQMEEILHLPVIFQLNVEVLSGWENRKLLHRLQKEERPIVFGTDCHNLTDRKPNFDLLNEKKSVSSVLLRSDAVFAANSSK